MNLEQLKAQVDTIVVVMMENRSFDHMLGHMRLPDYGGLTTIDGIESLANTDYANPSQNSRLIPPFIAADQPLPNDLPHERDQVATQLAFASVANAYEMNGFVKAYERSSGTTGVLRPPPMGLLTPRDLPMTRFFADEYAPCDRWFSALPTSTQPNRLMSLSGYTLIDSTRSGLLPDQHTVLDWCESRGVRWRVYSAGLSFFMLMKNMWPLVVTDHFRRLSALSHDVQHESDADWPQFILIEPDYNDSPVHLSGQPCDNHPPLPVGPGESFLRQAYEAITSNPNRFGRTVMLLTYDEHGGFFDHVPPHPVPYQPPAGASFTKSFDSTGVRVPAIVISPFVARGLPKHEILDNTSILQFVAERFGSPGEPYSPSVDARRQAGIMSITALLDEGPPRDNIPAAPSAPIVVTTSLTTTRDVETDQQKAFAAAIEEFASSHGPDVLAKFPEVTHWNNS